MQRGGSECKAASYESAAAKFKFRLSDFRSDAGSPEQRFTTEQDSKVKQKISLRHTVDKAVAKRFEKSPYHTEIVQHQMRTHDTLKSTRVSHSRRDPSQSGANRTFDSQWSSLTFKRKFEI